MLLAVGVTTVFDHVVEKRPGDQLEVVLGQRFGILRRVFLLGVDRLGIADRRGKT